MVDGEVNAAEVIGGFNDVIHVDGLVCDTDGVGFKDMPCLFFRESAALSMWLEL